jgi:hypothetical protein
MVGPLLAITPSGFLRDTHCKGALSNPAQQPDRVITAGPQVRRRHEVTSYQWCSCFPERISIRQLRKQGMMYQLTGVNNTTSGK